MAFYLLFLHNKGEKMLFINIALILCFLFGSCVNKICMTSAPIKLYDNGEGVAMGGVSGFSIIIKSGEWNGPPEVLKKITPVKVTIYNQTGRQIKVQYSMFCFKGKNNNNVYAAMPPYEIRGTYNEPIVFLPYPFPVQAQIEHNGRFRVAPHCARMYPGLPVYDGSYKIDISYYNSFYCRFAAINLPITEMLSRLIPDGVVEDCGYISGYLYFEKIQLGKEKVIFCVNLIDATNNTKFGTMDIPFCLFR